MQVTPLIGAATAATGWRAGLATASARLGSQRLTLIGLSLLGVAVAYVYSRPDTANTTLPLVLPIALLAVNLVAAIVSSRAFRRQTALLVFHLALLAIIILIGLGRLTYLRGTAEVVTGGEFEGLLTRETGPWHAGGLDAVHFANDGFTIHYSPGLQRDATANHVSWRDAAGLPQRAQIGDQVPFTMHGYRFYTTPNKGFAPVFLWWPDNGAPLRGAVNLPSYPMHEYEQAKRWTPPGAAVSLWIMLKFDEVLLDPGRANEFRLPAQHQLIVRSGDLRTELAPGARLKVPGGTLVYEGLSTWMGYAVFYDWTMSWLLAACALAVVALTWHLRDKYFARPWAEAAP